jgi:ribosomal protein S18 acetylase RimI-like enzyme
VSVSLSVPISSVFQFELVPADAHDSDFLFHLYASTRAEEFALLPWDEQQKSVFMRMQFDVRERAYASTYPAAVRSLVVSDGRKVGAVIVDRAENEIKLIDIALIFEARCKGIGTAVLHNLICEARSANKPLRLQVAKGNRAMNLYCRLGFTRTGGDEMYEQMELVPA